MNLSSCSFATTHLPPDHTKRAHKHPYVNTYWSSANQKSCRPPEFSAVKKDTQTATERVLVPILYSEKC